MLNLSVLVRFENQTIVIGKTYQGGIVFYIDGTGEHGLVASPADQGTYLAWSDASNLVSNLVLNGYDDWLLPSQAGLGLMYKNIGYGAAAPLTNIGGFAPAYYWGTLAVGYSDWAWEGYFGDHGSGGGAGGNATPIANFLYVRAVRAF
ncbi:hypothetical protein [Methylovulum psychrotolerans]|uniref:DUF1566 domain-containing protein n=1 Tax=Methylovulum psychrotolerans TaxID=1704499 RepID=A0A2S5CFT0_9GAMM|nr:hypothetical protein [Methylovulum psychrotolerans]POZ49663.1 hypothetical protein AADEFJLK_04556 [Methylovulum psychrotolerans]